MGRMSSLDKMWEEWGLLWKWALRTYFTTMGARSDSHFWSVCRVLLDKTGSWISDFSKVHGPSSVDRHCWILWTDRGRETACLWLTVGTEHQPPWGTPVLGLLRSCLDSAPVPLIGSLDLDWISLPAFFLGGGGGLQLLVTDHGIFQPLHKHKQIHVHMFPYLTCFFTSEECWEAHLYMLFLLGDIYFVYSNHLTVMTGHVGMASQHWLFKWKFRNTWIFMFPNPLDSCLPGNFLR